MANKKETKPVADEREYERGPEKWDSFRRRHGEFVIVGGGVVFRPGVDNQHLLFEDGAIAYSQDRNHNGVEPPDDIVECGRLRLAYAEEKLKREIRNYDKFLADCQQQAEFHARMPQSCPPPSPRWREQLEAGQKRIDHWRSRVAELNAMLDQHDASRIAKRERAEADLAAHEKRVALKNEVNAFGGGVSFVAHVGESFSNPL